MERRAFLALIASAPIAALAPLPTVLESGESVYWYLNPNVVTHQCGTGCYPPEFAAALRLDLADPAHVDLDRLMRVYEYLGLD